MRGGGMPWLSIRLRTAGRGQNFLAQPKRVIVP